MIFVLLSMFHEKNVKNVTKNGMICTLMLFNCCMGKKIGL